MRIKPGILDHLHLDKTYSLLSGVQVRLLYEVFQLLDIHESGDLNGKLFLLCGRYLKFTRVSAHSETEGGP